MQTDYLPLGKEERVVIQEDPLKLKMDDATLVEVIDEKLRNAETYWNGDTSRQINGVVKLTERQDKIERYLLGNQIDEADLHPEQKPYMENILWEAWIRNRAILMSRIPDIIIKPGNNTPESKETAKQITDVVDRDIKKIENADVLTMGAMQRPVYLFGVIKATWDYEEDDYKFINVHPQNIVLDPFVKDPQDARFIAEFQERTLKELIMMFPDKEDELLEAVAASKDWKEKPGRNDERKLATRITLWEVWFKENISVTDEVTGQQKWELVTGVVWKYQNIILGKMRHPYWDWEGKRRLFKAKIEEKQKLSEDDIYKMLFEGETEEVYDNYLSHPDFPYYVITLNRFGKMPIDVTTNYEQVLDFQDNINREGIMITDMNARSQGKDVFSVDGFEKAEDIELIDPKDPNQVIKVAGNVRDIHSHIDYSPATSQLYKSKSENRSIGFEMLALNATTRGTRETGDETLGARQMMREQDFGVLDYEVSRTLNPAAIWMGQWIMQFIKLFYTSGKMREMLGADGEMARQRLTQDMIEDGMEIEVSASSVDKMQRKRQAITDAQSKMSDPLSYFEAMDDPDPKERARRTMLFNMSPSMYMQKYLPEQGGDQGLAQQLA